MAKVAIIYGFLFALACLRPEVALAEFDYLAYCSPPDPDDAFDVDSFDSESEDYLHCVEEAGLEFDVSEDELYETLEIASSEIEELREELIEAMIEECEAIKHEGSDGC